MLHNYGWAALSLPIRTEFLLWGYPMRRLPQLFQGVFLSVIAPPPPLFSLGPWLVFMTFSALYLFPPLVRTADKVPSFLAFRETFYLFIICTAAKRLDAIPPPLIPLDPYP